MTIKMPETVEELRDMLYIAYQAGYKQAAVHHIRETSKIIDEEMENLKVKLEIID